MTSRDPGPDPAPGPAPALSGATLVATLRAAGCVFAEQVAALEEAA